MDTNKPGNNTENPVNNRNTGQSSAPPAQNQIPQSNVPVSEISLKPSPAAGTVPPAKEPVSPSGGTQTVVTQPPAAKPPESQPPASEPQKTVVVPEKKEKLPFWFYLLFAIVTVVFFSITALLVRALIDRNREAVPDTGNANVIITTPTAVQEAEQVPIDQVLLDFEEASTSDEITDIETDLNKSESLPLRQDLQQIEKEATSSS